MDPHFTVLNNCACIQNIFLSINVLRIIVFFLKHTNTININRKAHQPCRFKMQFKLFNINIYQSNMYVYFSNHGISTNDININYMIRF